MIDNSKLSTDDEFIRGSGDYLRDRGYKEPDEARAKLLLANKIAIELETRDMSQQEGARLTGLRQPDLSRIVNGNVRDYSVWRLMSALCRLGHEVSIDIRRSSDLKGSIVLRDGSDVVALAKG